MAYTKQTWGTYKYDESKSFADNLAAADKANALVTVEKIQHIEQGIADKQAKGDPGTPGKAGASIKAIALTKDENGLITGGKATLTDNSTVDITVG